MGVYYFVVFLTFPSLVYSIAMTTSHIKSTMLKTAPKASVVFAMTIYFFLIDMKASIHLRSLTAGGDAGGEG